MGQFSKIEWNNGRGYVEEISLRDFTYEASLFGFIRRVTIFIGNANRETPQVASGTNTTGPSATTLTDAAAKFGRDHVQPGDIVTNVTDGDAVWEVASVTSNTVLEVQLVISGGVDDDWDASDVYTIERRNLEDIYIPYTTEIRVTGRDLTKVIFQGVVQEAVPEDAQGRTIKVLAVARDSELRDGAPQTDAAALDARSAIIQDALDDNVNGSFLFPLISSFEGEPGLDHSPNQQTIQPDFSKSTRAALPTFLDLAKADTWCPDTIIEPTNPTVTFDTNDTDIELVPSAQGSLAQRFQVTTHTLVSKVRLRLKLVEAVPGNLLGNLYVRIEANSLSGDVTGLDVPSGEMVAPWAESGLVSIANAGTGATGALVGFVFNQPVVLRKNTSYWITLSYQEDNLVTYSAGVDFIAWRENAAGGYASGYIATYAASVWTANSTPDFAFAIFEHTDAVWLYDKGADTWTDFTTEAATEDISRFSWMGVGTDDRMYIRTAGPIYGLDLLIENTLASEEYGEFTVRYFGDDGAKLTGEHTGGTSSTVLTDNDKDFRRSGVVIGDVVHNKVDGSYGVVTIVGITTLTVTSLSGPGDDSFQIGDTYAVLSLEQRVTGVATSGSATTLGDTGAAFDVDGVREGDLVVNVTDSVVAVITAYTATLLTATDGALAFGVGDVYKVLSRWKTVTLKDSNNTFVVANTPRLEWEIPSDWVPTFIEAGMPEASDPGFTDVTDMRGYWLTIECASIPATRAEVDLVSPLPGTGFVLQVTDQTHEDTVLAAGGVHDGAADATALTDTGEDFIADHGILVGDIVENMTDGSRGTITAVVTTTNINDTLVATLAGGAENDWDVSDIYRVLRDRYRVRYFRNGSRPLGGPANFGLTLRQGAGVFKQMKSLLSPIFSKSSRSSVNRVRVVGRTSGGVVVDESANNLRAQREFRRVVSRTITDYSIKTVTQALDRANTELARQSNAARRGNVTLYSFPFFTKTRERQSWFAGGTNLLHKLDGSGSAVTVYEHDGGASAVSLTDTSQNFKKWCVEVGDLVTNITDGSSATVTAITTTTNENDTLVGVLSGGTDNDWDVSDEYKVEQRKYIEVGDLIHVKVGDPDYIDSDYIVAGIKYNEPSFMATLRLAQNLIAPAIGDQQTDAEIAQRTRDQADQASQRGGY